MESPTTELEESVGGMDKSLELEGGGTAETSDPLAAASSQALEDLVRLKNSCFFLPL